jgi:hypothetical protein
MSDAVLYFKRAPSLPIPQTVTASPFVYTNSTKSAQMVTISGGAVSLIEIDAGLGYVPQVGVAGTFLVLPNQSIRTTYVVSVPTITVVTL